MINLHTHHDSGQPGVVEIVNRYPDETVDGLRCFSTGLHPWYLDTMPLHDALAIIETRLKLTGCVAVGECGLDKRIERPLADQQPAFEQQLELAQAYGKPVILHCVGAYQEMIETRKRLRITVPMIIHGFSKNQQVAKSLLDNGFYLSFGKYLLQNPGLAEVLKEVPRDRLFLETDTITDGIEAVYHRAAAILQTDVTALEAQINQNFAAVFGPHLLANS
ncbi:MULTISPECIES: TatD family hydrolase [unclassified Flavobacterium]|uniref:TatD family hydrolase n=1 Tax=unclassified Flavobacterium TaxID=196869 RepID=UPI001F12EC48|nr:MULTISPECIES: TatD family hydrolase [unclassified Flavobacterium]UMY65264.1 TatD family hydrolase [Flavobacterium sp. HJ-32-4]